MKHLDLKINSDTPKVVSVSVTDSWNELSEDQILYIGLVWQSWQLMLKNGINMQLAKAKLLVALIVNKSQKELKEIIAILSTIEDDETNYDLLSLTDFVFQSNKLTANKFMVLKSGLFKKLYGPSDKLANISINEFSFALNFYNAYNKTGNEEFLNNFVACLYRPSYKNWEITGDKRKPFNPFTIEQHLPLVVKLNFAHKQAVYLYFTGCLEQFAQDFKRVFSRAESENSSQKQTFLDIILKIAGGKFGNFDQTKDQNAFLVLKELNNILEENQTKKQKS